jgi:diguanylate cyclase (GGDEF)-like protein
MVRDKQNDAEMRDRLEEMALRDSVTNIGSRHLFNMRLAHAMDRVGRDQSSIALLMVDLDGFKQVNDTLGHQAGDDVLREVGQRMQSVVRISDTVARLGGDEYIVIMETGVTDEGAQYLADRIRSEVLKPIRLRDEDVVVGISIGIALYPTDGITAEGLIKAADTAMYAGKKRAQSALDAPQALSR